MGEIKRMRSICRGCHGGCGVLIQVEGGRVTRVEGDPQGPANKGRLCIKGKMAPYLAHHPDPLIEVNPRFAKERGLKDGDWAQITSRRGSCKQRVKVTDRVPDGIVAAQHGWWFPEEKNGLGWDRSNINLLTENEFDGCDQAMGATNLWTLLCDIQRVPPT
ncbi:MAG: molybdopterin dinucleotide binding domain-containing protein [Thermodesulfobacteriota bacterium]